MDISNQYSKSVHTIHPETVDIVITLCAEEVCPVFLGKAERLHWPLPDPGKGAQTEQEQLEGFRKIRDELLNRLKLWGMEQGLMKKI